MVDFLFSCETSIELHVSTANVSSSTTSRSNLYSNILSTLRILLFLLISQSKHFNNPHLYALCSCDRASWAKREERIPTRCNNIDVLLSIPDVDYWLQSRHVSGIFMPIIRRKDHVLLHMGSSNLHSAHTLQRSTTVPQPATSNTTSKYTPYAVTRGLFSWWWA